MRKSKASILAVAAAALLPALASAQEPPPGSQDQRGGQRGAAMRRMRAVFIAEVQETLNLDDKTTIRLTGILKKSDQEEMQLRKDIKEGIAELEVLAHAEKPDGAKLSAALDRLQKARERIHGIKSDQIKEIRQILTPVQQARFVLLMDQFRKRMRDNIRKSWMEHGGPGGRGHGPGPRGPGPGPGMGMGMGPGGCDGPGPCGPPPPPEEDDIE
jgi:Spy/CpxP family protein refolding chaperone